MNMFCWLNAWNFKKAFVKFHNLHFKRWTRYAFSIGSCLCAEVLEHSLLIQVLSSTIGRFSI
ncbi:uncharacterized protein ASCRUDRAFT_155934 [Ascoidea rubescens DSM 1968]|uniref:Uncharacterized protein n=1 Tax=Ascoidea rubescens DSM 1968 TaxID=1344418 RepID=A0A1D2VEX3_9ASCO|nr:hypothetical protein ASCRUDRAFT_155934 [Ascoidea rubescens DSM 1968]ODV60070.1 hypothetical protein ASCRUDRAFT_155934 [Ascoidea rubescens DSM 1968]